MFTNGSRSARFFKKMVSTTKDAEFRVIFSFHPEYTKFENFKRAVEITAGAGLFVGINFTFLPRFRERIREYVDELLTLRMKLPFFMQINYPYTPDGMMGKACSAEDFAWIEASREAFERIPMPGHLKSPFFVRILSNITLERQGNRERLAPEESLQLLSKMQTPSYENFYCCSGVNVVFIEEDGSARGGVCDKSRYLGNVFCDSEIALVQNMKVVRCTASACASIENIPLPKFRDSAEAEACLDDFKNRAKAYLYRAEAARLDAEYGALARKRT
jgi:hypothetical protein